VDRDERRDSARGGDFAGTCQSLPHPVLGFEHREDAERFLEQLRERLRKFGLELHPEKTRLIECGRYAAARRKKRGEGKPETFNFLSFTHICGTNRQTGNFTVHRKTIGKRMAAKLKDIRATLRQRTHSRRQWATAVPTATARPHGRASSTVVDHF